MHLLVLHGLVVGLQLGRNLLGTIGRHFLQILMLQTIIETKAYQSLKRVGKFLIAEQLSKKLSKPKSLQISAPLGEKEGQICKQAQGHSSIVKRLLSNLSLPLYLVPRERCQSKKFKRWHT